MIVQKSYSLYSNPKEDRRLAYVDISIRDYVEELKWEGGSSK